MNVPQRSASLRSETTALLEALGVAPVRLKEGTLTVRSPITGETIATLKEADAAEVGAKIAASVEAFQAWRSVPAPRRGELVRLLGEELRAAQGRARAAGHASRPARSSPRASAKCRR